LERDFHLPALDVLVQEVERIAQHQGAQAAQAWTHAQAQARERSRRVLPRRVA
jgi:uncharacterized protein (UPF0276 family)